MKKLAVPFLLLVILGAGVWLRLGPARAAGNTLAGNEAEYYELGVTLSQKKLFTEGNGRPYAFRGIFYPSFIASLAWIWSPLSPYKARCALIALSCLMILMLWRIGSLAFSPEAGLFAAGFASLSPWLIHSSASLDVSSFLAFLILPFICWAALRWLENGRGLPWLGFAAGAGLLCRSSLFFLPFLFLALFHKRLGSAKKRLLLLTSCFFVLIPWTLRNYWHFREFLPFERQAAVVNFYDAARGLLTPPALEDSFKHTLSLKPELQGQGNDILREEMKKKWLSRPCAAIPSLIFFPA